MFKKSDLFLKNKISVIDSKIIMKDGTGLIAIFGKGDSRTVLIESGAEQRDVIKFEIKFKKSLFSLSESFWMVSKPDISNLYQLASTIQLLKNKSDTFKLIQTSHVDITLFQDAMQQLSRSDTPIRNDGEQDTDIIDAIGKINETIKFNEPRLCSIL